jgi:hypothetical protein
MGQLTKQGVRRKRWQIPIQKSALSTAKTAVLARREKQAASQREANSFNILTATMSCCQQNLSSRLLVCDDAVIATSRMEKRASALTVMFRLMWRGNGLGNES